MSDTDWMALFAATPHPAFPTPVPKVSLAPKGRAEDKAIGAKNTIGTTINNASPALTVIPGSEDGQPLSDPDSSADSVFSAKRPVTDPAAFDAAEASPLKGGENEALRKAVRDADRLGSKFRIVGANVEIEGELPDELRAALPLDQLYEYLGAAADDRAAIEFLAQLNVSPVLVTDIAAADAAMRDLGDGTDIIGLDFETGPPGVRPEPVRINRDGTVAKQQPKPSKAGLDPYSSVIQTAQMHAGGLYAYVFHGDGLKHLLESEWIARQHFVAHNAGFESKFARHRGIELQLDCTLQAYGLLHGVERYDRGQPRRRRLADAARTVLDLEPPKALQTSNWSAPRLGAGQVAYAATDAVLVYRLWQKLRLQLCRKRLWGYELQRDAIPAVADMELRGIGLDREQHASLVFEWRSEVADLEKQIVALTGNSPPKKGKAEREWIASVAGDLLPTWPRTDTGLLSATAADYARLEDVPAAQQILELRAKQTLIASFGGKIAALVNPVTGRIHAGFAIARAKTGRFSCSDPNLQNQPGNGTAPDYKNAFTAAPGYMLISGDWKQVELRAIAHISGCPAMTAVFEAGEDPHIETALALVKKTREEVSAEELANLRNRAKAVNFGTIYGVTGKGLAEIAWRNYRISMSVEEGDGMVARFFEAYPRIKAWMLESLVETARLGHIRIGVGRIVEARWEQDRELSPQQCANLPIQGICADLILRAITMTFDRLRDAKIRGGLIACIHDQLMLEVAASDAAAARRILHDTMTEAFALTFPGAPMTGGVVDITCGPSWGELHEMDGAPAPMNYPDTRELLRRPA